MTDSETPSDEPTENSSEDSTRLSRRGALSAMAGIGLLGLGAGTAGGTTYTPARGLAAIDPDATATDAWTVEVDGEPGLRLAGSESFSTDDSEITGSGNLLVGHLNDIDDGVVGATVAGGGLFDETDGEDGGNAVSGHFGVVGGGAFNRAGPEDGEPTDATMSTVAGGLRNLASGPRATVGGGNSNTASGKRAVVGGGTSNDATDERATVGGGIGNHAEGQDATVAGGRGNTANGESATVAGGRVNLASGERATVGGGRGNIADGERATVAGGVNNRATARAATVIGGSANTADGAYSFVTGREGDASGHEGVFVVGDSSEEAIEATDDDTAYFQMPIEAQSFNTTSTATAKTAVEPADPEETLANVESLSIATWEFADSEDGTHMGPMAEDFHDTFGLGTDERTIATVDADGVALSAIQGLAGRLDGTDERVAALETELERREERIDDLTERLARRDEQVERLAAALERKDERIDDLAERVRALED